MHQVVCYTEPSVWGFNGSCLGKALRNFLAGDWLNHLFITGCCGEKGRKHLLHQEKHSVVFSAPLSQWRKHPAALIQLMQRLCYKLYRRRHCCSPLNSSCRNALRHTPELMVGLPSDEHWLVWTRRGFGHEQICKALLRLPASRCYVLAVGHAWVCVWSL